MLMSLGLIASEILTSAELACEPSFTLRKAMCECSSIIPELKCFPLPSIISKAYLSLISSTASFPTAIILPSRIAKEEFLTTPHFHWSTELHS